MLAGFERFHDQVCVRVVTREDSKGVDIRVMDDLLVIGRCILEAEFFPGMLGVQSARGSNSHQFNVTGFFERGKENGVGEQARA